jgi:predicted transposase YdaD
MPVQQGREFMLAAEMLMGLRYSKQITEVLMQSLVEMENSVIWQDIFHRWRSSGEAAARVEGKAEGLVEGDRAIILRQGTKKFGQSGADTVRLLESITSAENLSQIGERMLTATSWDELLRD